MVKLTKKTKLVISVGIGILFLLVLFSYKSQAVVNKMNDKEEQPNIMQYKDSIISLNFQKGGGNSTYGKSTIVYKTTNNEIKEFNFNSYPVELKDIDGDGIREIIVPQKIGIEVELPNSESVYWHAIYHFNNSNERLELVSKNYPQYYNEVYIPKLQEEINNNPKFSSRGIKVREILRMLAYSIGDGQYSPTENGPDSVLELVKAGMYYHNIEPNKQQNNGIESVILGHWVSGNVVKIGKGNLDVKNGIVYSERAINPLHLYFNGKIATMVKDGNVRHVPYDVTTLSEYGMKDLINLKLEKGTHSIGMNKGDKKSFTLLQSFERGNQIETYSTVFYYVDATNQL